LIFSASTGCSLPCSGVDHLHAKDLSPNRHSPVLALEVAAAA
jgi:hypothetical protein